MEPAQEQGTPKQACSGLQPPWLPLIDQSLSQSACCMGLHVDAAPARPGQIHCVLRALVDSEKVPG